MTTAFYRTGTVAVTQNSKVVTGTGTNWTTGPTKPLAGDVFIFNNKMYEIDSVVSDTEIRLYRNFEDSTASSKSYAIMRNASLNISARIAAQVAQVVNQKQIMIDEFHDFLTNNTDSTVPLTDTLGNTIDVTPIPMLDKNYVEKIGGIDSAVNQAIQDINDKFDSYEYILMREAEARAIQWQNENVNFDASGFVHMGKAFGAGSTVNEGITAYSSDWQSTDGNRFWLGRGSESSGFTGTSKTDFAVTHIAGAITNIIKLGDDYNGVSRLASFQLPEAEDGTRVYDSTGDARGSGKASLDLKTDIDPNYGDIPTGTEEQILREAVGRAFDGACKNRDLRHGADSWVGTSSYAEVSIEDDTVKVVGLAGASSGVYIPAKVTGGVKYSITFEIVDKGNDIGQGIALTNVGGTLSPSSGASSNTDWFYPAAAGVYTCTFTPDTGKDSTSYWARLIASYSSVGATANFRVLEFKALTEEVVTHPVDLVALEYYEEELTGRQEIFECVQSISSTFGDTDIPTVLSTRKLSYFQQYDGQFPEVTANPDFINDRYRCVVWTDLTDKQKREVAAYMGEKLFIGVNGNIVNGRLRARTIRGAGNGDWKDIDSTTSLSLSFSNSSYLSPQGVLDYQPTWVKTDSDADYDETYIGNYEAYKAENVKDIVGAFVLRHSGRNKNKAYQGRCFMYVVATVPRANKGAYHPALNPWGAANVETLQETGSHHWYLAPDPVKTEADCFTRSREGTGSIGTVSGHPDDIFYDGIEASGLNGIIDWRLPAVANDSPEEAAKVEAKVENGTYRGLEKLVWTKVGTVTTSGAVYSGGFTKLIGSNQKWSSEFSDWDNSSLGGSDNEVDIEGCYIIDHSGNIYPLGYVNIRIDQDSSCYVSKTVGNVASSFYGGGTFSVVILKETNLSVSGEFNTQMVVGSTPSILQIKALENGWLGTWGGVFDGSSKITFSRKSFSSKSTGQNTNDDGATWDISTPVIDPVTNDSDFGGHNVPTRVGIYPYKAFAKQTKLSENKPVYNGKAGLMPVLAMNAPQPQLGVLFAESLIGKILKDTLSKTTEALGSPWGYRLKYPNTDRLEDNGLYNPIHNPVTLGNSTGSQAVKVLPYQISNNGQGSIGYQANELTWETPNIQDADSPVTAVAENDIYYITSGASSDGLSGHTIRVKADNPAITWANYIVINGVVCVASSKQPSSVLKVWDDSGWGDDATIKITDEGLDTFVDLNGNTNLSVVHELAIPYTWTSNHARAGEQIEGVDL